MTHNSLQPQLRGGDGIGLPQVHYFAPVVDESHPDETTPEVHCESQLVRVGQFAQRGLRQGLVRNATAFVAQVQVKVEHLLDRGVLVYSCKNERKLEGIWKWREVVLETTKYLVGFVASF